MLNSLEKMEESKRFFKVHSMLPASIGLRFHKRTPLEVASENEFIKSYLENSKEHQGVYRCSLP